MNPFLYKPHPLLLRWADILAHPAVHGLLRVFEPVFTLLALNLLFTLALRFTVEWAAGFRLPFPKTYLLALPACLGYLPPMLTVLSDVATGAFRWEDRFIPVFTIFIASQMFAGFYTVAVRLPYGRETIGVAAGMAVSLILLLVAIPASLVLQSLFAMGAFPS